MLIKICVGSSCHLKGTQELVKLFTQKIADQKLDAEIKLAGSFCFGLCNREGVTVEVDGVIHTGVTPEGFETFFSQNVLTSLNKGA